jgi:hypothetical protein
MNTGDLIDQLLEFADIVCWTNREGLEYFETKRWWKNIR